MFPSASQLSGYYPGELVRSAIAIARRTVDASHTGRPRRQCALGQAPVHDDYSTLTAPPHPQVRLISTELHVTRAIPEGVSAVLRLVLACVAPRGGSDDEWREAHALFAAAGLGAASVLLNVSTDGRAGSPAMAATSMPPQIVEA